MSDFLKKQLSTGKQDTTTESNIRNAIENENFLRSDLGIDPVDWDKVDVRNLEYNSKISGEK